MEAQDKQIKRFFLFFYFLFLFFTKIYFRFGNLQKYTPAARLPGGRDLNAKKEEEKLQTGPWGRSPGSGAAGPLAARQLGGRLYHPYIRVGWSPHPSFASLQFQKQRKKREGGREAKPCRIFETATAGNQNSSTLYK